MGSQVSTDFNHNDNHDPSGREIESHASTNSSHSDDDHLAGWEISKNAQIIFLDLELGRSSERLTVWFPPMLIALLHFSVLWRLKYVKMIWLPPRHALTSTS